jgi:hypothetical protein
VLPGFGPGVVRAAALVPATLIILFVGVLWLLGLACDERRRSYVEAVSEQAMQAVEVLMGAPAAARTPVGGERGLIAGVRSRSGLGGGEPER